MTEKNNLELTILMPCLNEAETIVCCIQKAKQFIENNKIQAEILIADNGSTDGSQKLAVENGARLITVQKKGYGAALIEGSMLANGKYIIMGDADDSYDFSDLGLFLEKLRQGCDLVVGNRFAGGIQKNAMPWKNKYIGNPILSLIGRILFKTPVKDFHCGLRGYTKDAFINMQLVTTGMEFASEMIIKACFNKLKIEEVPTKLYPDGRSRPPHLRPWRDGWRHLKFMFLLSPNWLLLYPALLVICMGGVSTSLLLQKPIHLKEITFDIHTLLFTTIITLIGFQMLSLYLVLKNYTQKIKLSKMDSISSNFFRFFSLEKGIIISLALFIFGIIHGMSSFIYWKNLGFGQIINISESLRQTIPSIFCLALSLQIFVTSASLAAIDFISETKYTKE